MSVYTRRVCVYTRDVCGCACVYTRDVCMSSVLSCGCMMCLFVDVCSCVGVRTSMYVFRRLCERTYASSGARVYYVELCVPSQRDEFELLEWVAYPYWRFSLLFFL